MKRSLIICLGLLYASLMTAKPASLQLMEEAIAAYQEAKYDRAIDIYEEVLASGTHSVAVYFNLGNAYFKVGNIPEAILNYERALLLDPSDKEVAENLDFVRTKIPVEPEPLPAFFLHAWWLAGSQFFSAGAWGTMGLILLWIAAGGWIVWLLGKTRQLKKNGFMTGLAGILLAILPLALAFGRKNHENAGTYAILMEESALLRAPDDASQVLVPLEEGWKVSCIESFEGWHKIRLGNGDEGWVPAEDIKKIVYP